MTLIHTHDPHARRESDNEYTNYCNSHVSGIKDIPMLGKKRRLNNMQRRLSMFFNMTKSSGQYANNRNSKGRYVPVFITLTYPSNKEWIPTDISNYCKKIKQYSLVNWGMKLRIAWVAETTKNGVIHYHLVTWIPRNKRLPKPSEAQIVNGRTHAPMWKYRAKLEGVRKGVYGYMLKYMSKGCETGGLGIYKEKLSNKVVYVQTLKETTAIDKDFNPTVLPGIPICKIPMKKKYPRLFGYSGMTTKQRKRLSYYMLPHYVREAFGYTRVDDSIRRVKGGFQLHKANPVDSIYKYFSYAHESLKSGILGNFTKFTYELNQKYYIEYYFGANWSFLPEVDTSDQFFFAPF